MFNNKYNYNKQIYLSYLDYLIKDYKKIYFTKFDLMMANKIDYNDFYKISKIYFNLIKSWNTILGINSW